MDTCDVLIVGGGPAGSSCAWRLRGAGLDVAVIDKAAFPRDKVCAGWITPQVVEELAIDTADYASSRTFQPITSFRVGVIGRDTAVNIDYGRPVSYGIRRCEFDDYLLRRSGARLLLGRPVIGLRREQRRWIVNEEIAAAVVIGAGGHFCPIAKALGESTGRAPVVAAQEAEFPVEARAARSLAVAPERPELYFCADFTGYGWCFRKQDHLNIGFGRLDARELPAATSAFVGLLKRWRRVPEDTTCRWRGHAYLLAGPVRRPVRDGVMLIGDAAGLAYAESGEGIRPAVESGLMAATVILEARGTYSLERLAPYGQRLRERFASGPSPASHLFPSGAIAALGGRFLRNRWFVRNMVLSRWFLHAHQAALPAD